MKYYSQRIFPTICTSIHCDINFIFKCERFFFELRILSHTKIYVEQNEKKNHKCHNFAKLEVSEYEYLSTCYDLILSGRSRNGIYYVFICLS